MATVDEAKDVAAGAASRTTEISTGKNTTEARRPEKGQLRISCRHTSKYIH